MGRGGHKPHRSRHACALRSLLFGGICDRRLQGHWSNAAPQLVSAAMSRDELVSVVNALSDALVVLRSADPADKPRSTLGSACASSTSLPSGLSGPRSTSALLSMGNSKVPEGGIDPVSPHCSMCYSAEVDLQQADGPYAL
jgi:hypothetical protein